MKKIGVGILLFITGVWVGLVMTKFNLSIIGYAVEGTFCFIGTLVFLEGIEKL